MAVDIPQAAPVLLPMNSLTTSIGEYDVVGVLLPEAAGTPLRVRERSTGALAELCFLQGAESNAVSSEKNAMWRHAVTGWTQALTAVAELGAHPHIQHILDFGEVDAGFYVLLDLVEGRTLRQTLQEDGPLPLEWLLPVCSQLASALDFTAAHHIFHTNLSPDNVVLSGPNPRVCLRGLGLSSLQRKAVTIFTSPEQAAGQPADARSDIYSLGALLYTCLSGRPPFAAASRAELCRKIQSESPAPLSGQPAWIRDIIACAMQRAPERRYRVAVDIVNDLTYQRSPAPLQVATVIPVYDNDCSLGHYMPEMALKADTPELVFHERQTSSLGLLTRLLSSLQIYVPVRDTRHLSARQSSLTPPPAEAEINAPCSDLLAAEVNAPDLPQPVPRGFLGRFNRYMALQEYVILAPDDPTRHGWRGLMRRLGLSRAVPTTSRLRKRWRLTPRLAKRLEVGWRRTRRVALLSLVLLAVHTQILIGDQGHAAVADVNGLATVTFQDGLELPLQEQTTLSGDTHPILTTRTGSAHLTLSNARLSLERDTRVQFRQLAYTGESVRQIELLRGRITGEIAPQETNTGHFDVTCNDVQAHVMPIRASNGSSGSTVFVMVALPHGAKVMVVRGRIRVYSNLSKRFVSAGSQLTVIKGRPLQKPMPIDTAMLASLLAQHRQNDEKSGLIRSLASVWRHLYGNAQEKWLMPALNKSWGYLTHRHTNALDEASRSILAWSSMEALGKSIASMTDPPEQLNLEKLSEIEIDSAQRRDLLQLLTYLDGKRLLAYRLLEPGSYMILARIDNEAKTLLKLKDGVVSAVPEDEETEALAEANPP